MAHDLLLDLLMFGLGMGASLWARGWRIGHCCGGARRARCRSSQERLSRVQVGGLLAFSAIFWVRAGFWEGMLLS